MEFAVRDATVSKQEAVAIHYETTFDLFRIREQSLRLGRAAFSITSAVEDVLKEELDAIKHFESEYEEDEPNNQTSNL